MTALSLAGRLDFNPLRDKLVTANGNEVMLAPPSSAELPALGYVPGDSGCIAPTDLEKRKSLQVVIDVKSDRLQKLESFKPWDGKDFEKLAILLKVKGKCTTDHISPAGPWLKFRGHLDHISDNMFLGAVDAYTGAAGQVKNWLEGGKIGTPAEIARDHQKEGLSWVVIGDENYGEGSSREHAAMSPRFLGCKAVVAKSFARIHETNLKKQGVLALIFADPKDYDKVREGDKASILGLKDFASEKNLGMLLTHLDGSTEKIPLRHTFTAEQIEWFKAGSALNLMKDRETKFAV